MIRIHDAGVKYLAAGIVQRAIEDYCFYLAELAKKPAKKKGHNRNVWPVEYHSDQLEELRKFFRGKWFGLISDLDPEYVMKLCEERHPGRIVLMVPNKRQSGSPIKDPQALKKKKQITAHTGDRLGRCRTCWQRIAKWPELQAYLLENRVMQIEMAEELRVHPTTLIGIMDRGTEKTRRRMEEAARRIVERRGAP